MDDIQTEPQDTSEYPTAHPDIPDSTYDEGEIGMAGVYRMW